MQSSSFLNDYLSEWMSVNDCSDFDSFIRIFDYNSNGKLPLTYRSVGVTNSVMQS